MAYISFQPSDHFNTKLYTGNATDDTAITGVGFRPDWLWGKNRTDATNHYLIDAVRGVTKELNSNNSDAEGTDATLIKSFDSDGFTLGNGSLNQSAKNFVAWNWLANGSGSSNTDGSITSTVSANTTSGFSIVSYTGNGTLGATVGHGLGQTPGVFLTKRLSGTSSWGMYHQSTGAGGFMEFNGTSGLQSNAAYFNNTAPTSSVFSIGTDAVNNTSGSTYIAYCFAEKKGFSKFGSYSANNNADGPFIFTGFSPAFVMIKSSNDTRDWCILDNKRPGYNVVNKDLRANETDVESTQDRVDFLSNGFKLRNASGAYNSTGNTYIYMAFSDQSIVSSNGVPAVAR